MQDGLENNNVNSDQFYNQYSYTVPNTGLYLIIASQRLQTGTDGQGNELYVRVLNSTTSTSLAIAASGGHTWVRYCEAVVHYIGVLNKDDVLKIQSSGGGPAVSAETSDGAITIARIA